MKNHKKGFIVPLIIFIVVLIVGIAVYSSGKRENIQSLVSNTGIDTNELISSLMQSQDINVFPAIRDELAKAADSETVAAIAKAYHEDAKQGWQQSNLMGVILRIRSDAAVLGLGNIVKNDSDSALRSQAATALALTGSPAAIRALAVAIEEDTSAASKRILAESLAAVANEKALDSLIDLLNQSKDEVVRYGVALALGNFPKTESKEALLAAQKNESSSFAKYGIDASLKKLSKVQ